MTLANDIVRARNLRKEIESRNEQIKQINLRIDGLHQERDEVENQANLATENLTQVLIGIGNEVIKSNPTGPFEVETRVQLRVLHDYEGDTISSNITLESVGVIRDVDTTDGALEVSWEDLSWVISTWHYPHQLKVAEE